MSKTIREYVHRRLQWFYASWAVGITLILVPRLLDGSEQSSHILGLAGLLVLALAAMMMASVRCPRCSKVIGNAFMWQRGTPEFCPQCQGRLDEPLP
jgi:hypothetical protein